jgi:hypothetical protein
VKHVGLFGKDYIIAVLIALGIAMIGAGGVDYNPVAIAVSFLINLLFVTVIYVGIKKIVARRKTA